MTKKKLEPKELKEPKKLTNDELLYLQLSNKDRYYHQLNIKYVELQVEKAEKELTLLSANYTLKKVEIEQCKDRLKQAKESMDGHATEHKGHRETINKRLNLGDRWGFDPRDGLIKEN